ncbi:MAG: sulfatase-like hydrolase/transferase [Spirochaetaceae bacterium]|nr:sulfatase-like hydrolase/transferase [Spirochaetaceae bacterium]
MLLSAPDCVAVRGVSVSPQAPPPARRKPHVLIVMLDQLRADSLGCAGHPVIRTPAIDAMAAQGLRFTGVHTVSPVCQPSRVSFATGRYPHNHGIWYNRGELPVNYPTFFTALRDAGYASAVVGKSHLWSHKRVAHLRDGEPYLQALGFDEVDEVGGPRGTCSTDSGYSDHLRGKGLWELFVADTNERVADPTITRPAPFDEHDHMDGYVGGRAVQCVEAFPDDRPTCLFVNFPGPHDPWDAPGRWAAMYDPADSPPPIPLPPRPPTLPDHAAAKLDFQPEPGLTPKAVAAIRANYGGKVSFVDHWCRRIFDAYAARGWLDDLLVVVTSDHGEMAGDHGRVYKRTFHESALRVPLIMRWPGRIPHGTRAAPAENIDVMPTVLEAIGVPQPPMSLGRSLLPVISDPRAQHRGDLLSEIYYGGSRNAMLKTERHKYVIDQQGRGYMLYDLGQDPDEQHNLIGAPEARALEQAMRDALLVRLAASSYVMDSVNL